MTRRLIPWVLVLFLGLSALGFAQGQQPDEQTYESDNFTLTVPAGFTDRNAIDATLKAFEEARAFLIGNLGYLPPPVDGRYQVYGADVAVAVTRRAPGGSGGSDPTFIVLPLSSLDDAAGPLRALAVHEFFHAVQYGYNGESENWIREAASAWVEGVFVDTDETLIYLPAFVPEPRRSLDDPAGLYEYGAFIFFQYLVERFDDPGIVREVWEEIAVPAALPGAPNRPALEAIAAVLDRRGMTLAEAWGEFQLWRLRLRAHFEEGVAYARAVRSAWPSFLRRTKVGGESCRLDTDLEDAGLPPMSGDYVRLEPRRNGPARSTARLAVNGPQDTAGFYVLKPRGGPPVEVPLAFDEEGVASAEVPFGRAEIARLTVGLSNAAISGGRETIGYSLRLRGANRVTMSAVSGPSAANFGTGVVLSGSVECRDRPAPFAEVLVTARAVVSGAEQTHLVETNEFGRWTLRTTPEQNSSFVAEVVDPLISAARTDSFRVNVRVVVTIEVAQERMPSGSPVVMTGAVHPAHSGVEVVAEYRRPGGDWITGRIVESNLQGEYSAQFELPGTGIWEVRTRVDDTRDGDHIGNASAIRLVEVTG